MQIKVQQQKVTTFFNYFEIIYFLCLEPASQFRIIKDPKSHDKAHHSKNEEIVKLRRNVANINSKIDAMDKK